MTDRYLKGFAGLHTDRSRSSWTRDKIKTVKRGESEISEFKQTFDRQTVETLCVFANAGGVDNRHF